MTDRRKNVSVVHHGHNCILGPQGVIVPINEGAGSFTPADLGPLHWFDAGDESTITKSGTDITAWNDKGSKAVNLSALGSDDPQFVADDPSSGVNGILFDRTNDEALDTGSSISSGSAAIQEGTEVYVWIVFAMTNNSNQQFMWEIPTSDNKQVICGFNTASSGYFFFSNGSAGGSFTSAFSWAGDSNIHIVEIHYNGDDPAAFDDVAFKLDDVSKTTTSQPGHGSFDNDLRVGGVTSVKANGKIYELVVANTTSANMYTYLANRWGVS